jgi:hypothetical protein
VVLGEVEDQLLDDDGLAHPGPAEETDLAAAQVGLDEVDDLDPGLEHLELGRLVGQGGGCPVDGVALVGLDRPQLVHRLPDDVEHAAQGAGADGNHDGSAGVHRPHSAHHAVGGQHAHAADAVLPEVLLHLQHHVHDRRAVLAVVLHPHRVVDRGDPLGELDVHHGADDLHDLTDVF